MPCPLLRHSTEATDPAETGTAFRHHARQCPSRGHAAGRRAAPATARATAPGCPSWSGNIYGKDRRHSSVMRRMKAEQALVRRSWCCPRRTGMSGVPALCLRPASSMPPGSRQSCAMTHDPGRRAAIMCALRRSGLLCLLRYALRLSAPPAPFPHDIHMPKL